MLYFRGDIHGEHGVKKMSNHNHKMRELDKGDSIIILGDFGFVWSKTFTQTDLYWLNWMSKKPYAILWVAGNHENFARINSDEFETIPMFGDFVKKTFDNVYMLQTGHIYTIDGKKVFVYGGGLSVDKEDRKPYVSWWPEEIPSSEQFNLAVKNLASVDNKVDVIVSHASHQYIFDRLPFAKFHTQDPLHRTLENFRKNVEYKLWLAGHYHCFNYNKESKSIVMYNDVLSYDDGISLLNQSINGVEV